MARKNTTFLVEEEYIKALKKKKVNMSELVNQTFRAYLGSKDMSAEKVSRIKGEIAEQQAKIAALRADLKVAESNKGVIVDEDGVVWR